MLGTADRFRLNEIRTRLRIDTRGMWMVIGRCPECKGKITVYKDGPQYCGDCDVKFLLKVVDALLGVE